MLSTYVGDEPQKRILAGDIHRGEVMRIRSAIMFIDMRNYTTSGDDPSYVPFCLPWQTTQDGSLSPYWTETLPCQADALAQTCEGCLDDEFCLVNEEMTSCSCATRATVK